MMSGTIRRFAIAGVVVLALGGCSFGADPAERLGAAADATRAEKTARTEMTVTVDTDDGDAQLMLQARGEVDFVAEQASMELEVPGIPGPLRTVVDGGTTYTRVPAAYVDDGAGWVRRERAGGLGLGPGLGVASDHPGRMLAAVSATADEPDRLGSDEVHGTPVDGFEVSVRGADLAETDVPSAFAELAIPVQAWLDGDGRVRKLVASVDLATLMGAVAGESGDGEPAAALEGVPATEGTVRVLFELFDFGAETDIRVPTEDELVDDPAVGQLFEGRPRSGGTTRELRVGARPATVRLAFDPSRESLRRLPERRRSNPPRESLRHPDCEGQATLEMPTAG